jgi:Raf kinase inhibitor-like YbhB/YbcL family protein
MQLKSDAFSDGQAIPVRYTADGEDVSPPLAWSEVPQEAKSLALVVEDPDAPSGTFRHWALYNIDPGTGKLPEGQGNREKDKTGVNDFGERGYNGPSPPRGGGTHHYHFKLAALDVDKLDAPRNAKVDVIWRLARDHAIDVAELTGTYQR